MRKIKGSTFGVSNTVNIIYSLYIIKCILLRVIVFVVNALLKKVSYERTSTVLVLTLKTNNSNVFELLTCNNIRDV